jgi:hypothetical protein
VQRRKQIVGLVHSSETNRRLRRAGYSHAGAQKRSEGKQEKANSPEDRGDNTFGKTEFPLAPAKEQRRDKEEIDREIGTIISGTNGMKRSQAK